MDYLCNFLGYDVYSITNDSLTQADQYKIGLLVGDRVCIAKDCVDIIKDTIIDKDIISAYNIVAYICICCHKYKSKDKNTTISANAIDTLEFIILNPVTDKSGNNITISRLIELLKHKAAQRVLPIKVEYFEGEPETNIK